MSASKEDINLIIIHNKKHTILHGVKGCGVILWDIRFGLFAADNGGVVCPNISWLNESAWNEDSIEIADKLLDDPVYGSTTIDFDRREVVDANGYGSSVRAFTDWVIRPLIDPSEDDIFTPETLRQHIEHGRVSFVTGADEKVLMPDDVKTDFNKMTEIFATWKNLYDGSVPAFAVLALPNGWVWRSEDK